MHRAPSIGKPCNCTECPTLHNDRGDQLYRVLHYPLSTSAIAVLPGPFPTERPYSYAAWARWARFLAANGMLAVRFDYRGVGESSGSFAEATIGGWIADLVELVRDVSARLPDTPVLLHGLGFGGLIAAQVFRKGIGNALLTWSAPNSGAEAMREAFSRRLMMDFVTAGPNRKTWETYVAELEAGETVPVQGCPLNGRMWQEAQIYALDLDDSERRERPVRHVKLGRDAAPLVAGIGQWRALNPALQVGYVPLNPDQSKLFDETLSWIRAAIEPEP